MAAVAAVGVAMLVVAGKGDAALSESDARGRQIYLEGTAVSGQEITARVGPQSIPVPASAVVCAGCHGRDGRGRPESGVYPSDIRWSRLTKPYGAVASGGRRRHPPYDEGALARALSAGVDPGGNRLDFAMPRFQMAPEDLRDLMAYVMRLEADLDPGLEEDRVVLGTVTPRNGPLARSAAVMSAYFDDLNATGGIYGRRIELRVARADSPDEGVERARELLAGGQVFALVGVVSGESDAAFGELAEAHGVPSVAPFTQITGGDAGRRPHTFYLLAGIDVQGRALVDYAGAHLSMAGTQAVVVHRKSPGLTVVAHAMAEQARRIGWRSFREIAFSENAMGAEELVAQLEADGVSALFFLGDGGEFRDVVRAAHQQEWAPHVFLPGYLAGRDAVTAPASFRDRIYVAYPTSPHDHSPEGRREFGDFHARYQLPRDNLAAQVAAYTAAKVLVQGLKESGRELSREKLVNALEGLYEYSTGLTPPLTFGPNRRVGALGAYVVAVDVDRRQFAGGALWVEPR